jgi:membrane-associated phospholipid phosphatase
VVPWLVVAVVAFGRVYVGAHNPLDVVGGVGLGLVIAGVLNAAVRFRRLEPAGRPLGRSASSAGAGATGREPR